MWNLDLPGRERGALGEEISHETFSNRHGQAPEQNKKVDLATWWDIVPGLARIRLK